MQQRNQHSQFQTLNFMKNLQKWLIFCLFLTKITQIQAQTVPITATYNTSETGRLDRVASKAVIFNVGYEYNNNTSGGFLKAYIDDGSPQNVPYTPSLTTQSDLDNKTINTGLPVGAVAGAHSVSLTGSASYSIPINIAAGTQGMMPSLAIGYNSHAGNGLLGMGWNLGGLSAISRSGKDIYHEGTVSTVENTDGTDFYTLDGNRLTLKSGTYGSSGSTYSTEEETFSQITLNGAGLSTWFKVETKDGKVLEYGNTDVSRHNAINAVMYWQLNKITDVYGNYVLFKYVNADNQFLLDEIQYTGNDAAGISPYNSVKFTYATRQDANTVYIAGSVLKNKYLLVGIKSLAEGATVSEYAFTYGNNDLYSFLTKVEQLGSDGSRLNATIFKYGDESGFSSTQVGVIDGESYDMFSGDFNGDGFTDLVRAERVPNTTYHNKLSYFKNDDGSFSGTANGIIGINGFNTAFNFPNGGEYSSKYSDYLVADADGDGRDNIFILERSAGANSLTAVKVYGIDPDFSHFTETYSFAIGTDGAKYFDNPNANFLPGDFDGDGRMDFITILRNTSGTFTPKIFFPNAINPVFSSALTGNMPNFFFSPSNWQNAKSIHIIDFDGDGKQDILLTSGDGTFIEVLTFDRTVTNTIAVRGLYSSPSSFSSSYFNLYFGDFNGDRKADMLQISDNDPNAATISYSTGKDFVPKPFTLLGAGNAPKLQIGDFNGDGASDILNSYTTSTSTPDPSGDPDAPRIVTYSTKINIYYFSGDNYQFVQYIDNQRSKATAHFRRIRAFGFSNPKGKSDCCKK
jgi:Salmonella virulence plasmid 65kDa B protein/FG-GAP-like repeat